MNTHASKPTLVLGGTGKTGRRVVERLTERGLPVRVGSRSGKPPFDWEDRSTWAPALEGVGAAYVSLLPGHRGAGRGRDRRRVRRAGRERWRPQAGAALRPRRAGGRAGRGGGARHRRRPDRSCARPGSCRTSARTTCSTTCLSGEVRLPGRRRAEPFVDADDIADVAVAALTDDRHIGAALRADRPALADVRRGGRRDRRGRRAGEVRYTPVSLEQHAAEAARARRSRRRRSSCSRTCSARSWTAATPTPPTASGARSAASRATSQTTHGKRPRAACGTRPRCTRKGRGDERCPGVDDRIPGQCALDRATDGAGGFYERNWIHGPKCCSRRHQSQSCIRHNDKIS